MASPFILRAKLHLHLLHQFQRKDDVDQSLKGYEAASEIASKELPPTHPIPFGRGHSRLQLLRDNLTLWTSDLPKDGVMRTSRVKKQNLQKLLSSKSIIDEEPQLESHVQRQSVLIYFVEFAFSNLLFYKRKNHETVL
ncbi:hypothetical protein ACFE04_007994 [Oxalis oulophora]